MNPLARRKVGAKAAIDRAIREAFATIPGPHSATTAAFGRLLRSVRLRSGLLRPRTNTGRSDRDGHDEVLAGLLALATCHWLRPVEDWEPAGEGLRPQFASLVAHLLAAYPVPAFLASAWPRESTAEAWRHRGWYMQVGAGQNIRHADLPLPYTKRMAHHFLQAPDHSSVGEALRWGQVRGLGGSAKLALSVASTRLGRSFESEDFWATVVMFLVAHPEIDLAQVGSVVEYLHHRRFVPEEVLADDDELLALGPPQPDLSMKGRTSRALLRQVGEWRRRPRGPRKLASLRWPPTGIGAYRRSESDEPDGPRCWTIRELTRGDELRREGEAMRHCVATYAGDCSRRATSIWSMRFEDDGRHFRVMTIEVDPATRTIRQARRRGNAPPNEKALCVLRRWAGQEALRLEFWDNGALVLA